jgi:hypothetical protein
MREREQSPACDESDNQHADERHLGGDPNHRLVPREGGCQCAQYGEADVLAQIEESTAGEDQCGGGADAQRGRHCRVGGPHFERAPPGGCGDRVRQCATGMAQPGGGGRVLQVGSRGRHAAILNVFY